MKRQLNGERDLSALAMFAEELKLARAAAGLTQEQLAGHGGYPGAPERGTTRPDS